MEFLHKRSDVTVIATGAAKRSSNAKCRETHLLSPPDLCKDEPDREDIGAETNIDYPHVGFRANRA